MNTTTNFRISICNLNPYSLNFHRIKKPALVLFLVFGGYLFNSRISFAQGCKDRPVYTCRLPLNEKTYTCEIPVKDCKNNILPSKETLQVKENDDVPKAYPKCGLDVLIKTVEVRTETENLPDKPIENLSVIETLPKTIIEEVPFVELVQDPPYSCMLVEPYLEELINIPSPIIDGEFEAEEAVTTTLKGEEVYESVVSGKSSVVQTTNNGQLTTNIDLTCYPNPTSNGFINIKYSVTENVPTSIEVFDLNGNLVKTLVQSQNLYAADYQTQFDVSDLQDGIYFCQLISGNNKTTTRIVISK